jgi:glycosyltransferase involved in cell wall biosynthesis
MNILYVHHRKIYSGAEKVLNDMLSSKFRTWNIFVFNPISQEKINLINSKYFNSYNLTERANRSIHKYIIDTYRSSLEIIHIIKSENIDVIHYNTFFSALRFFLLILFVRIRFNKIKQVYTLHDIFIDYHNRFLASILAFLVNNAIAVSYATKNQFNVFSKRYFKVIHNGFEVNLINNKNFNLKNVTIIGVFDPWKGQLGFIKSKSADQLSKIVLMGSDDNLAYKNEVIINSKDNVKIFPFQKNPWNLVKKENVSILLVCSTRPDPFPTVVLEAISNGIIPIVPDEGGAMELIPENLRSCLVYTARNYNQIIDKIHTLNNQNLSSILLCLQKNLKNNFNQEIKCNLHLNIYNG